MHEKFIKLLRKIDIKLRLIMAFEDYNEPYCL